MATKYVSESKWIAAFPLDVKLFHRPTDSLVGHLGDITKLVRPCETETKRHQDEEHYQPVFDLVLNHIIFAKARTRDL